MGRNLSIGVYENILLPQKKGWRIWTICQQKLRKLFVCCFYSCFLGCLPIHASQDDGRNQHCCRICNLQQLHQPVGALLGNNSPGVFGLAFSCAVCARWARLCSMLVILSCSLALMISLSKFLQYQNLLQRTLASRHFEWSQGWGNCNEWH